MKEEKRKMIETRLKYREEQLELKKLEIKQIQQRSRSVMKKTPVFKSAFNGFRCISRFKKGLRSK